MPNEQIYPVETSLDWISLTTLPETYYTAFLAFKSLQIKETDRILVRGATSGLGPAFLKLVLGKFPDAKVDGSTRSLQKRGALLDIGYHEIILEKDGELQTEESYDKILELIGPATVKDSLHYTREFGIVCSCGQLGGKWYLEDFDPIMELGVNKYLTTAYSGAVSEEKIQDLIRYVEMYQIDVKPAKIYTLEEVQKAHERMESGKNIGKNIVLLGTDE